MPSFEDLEKMIHRQHEETTSPENDLSGKEALSDMNDPKEHTAEFTNPDNQENLSDAAPHGPGEKIYTGIENIDSTTLSEGLKLLGGENKEYYQKMTPRGKEHANTLFGLASSIKTEGVTGILSRLAKPRSMNLPSRAIDTNNIFAKLEIASANLKLWWKEGPAAKTGAKLVTLNEQLGELNETIKEIDTDIKHAEDAREQQALELQMNKLIAKKNRLENTRNETHEQYKMQKNDIMRISNERRAIAKGMIERYDADVRPLHNEMNVLQQNINIHNQKEKEMTANHQMQEEILAEMEKRLMDKEKRMEAIGCSKKEINETLSFRWEKIAQAREKMRLEKKGLEKIRGEVNARIGERDKEASAPRNKMRFFEHIANLRPALIEADPIGPINEINPAENIQSGW